MTSSSTNCNNCNNCNNPTPDSARTCPACHAILIEVHHSFDPMTDDHLTSFTRAPLVHERIDVIYTNLRKQLPASQLAEAPPNDAARKFIRESVNSDVSQLTMLERGIVLQHLLDEFFGFGPLGPLLRDPRTEAIFCTGPDSICVEHSDSFRKVLSSFKSQSHLQNIIDRLASILNQQPGSELPSINGRLPNGCEVRICLPPLVRTTTLSIHTQPQEK